MANQIITKVQEASDYQKHKAAKEEKKQKILSSIDTLSVDDLKTINIQIKKDVLGTGPRNSSELHKCIEILFNVSVPLTATATDTVAPFQWISDVYFGKAVQSFAIGSRLSGKTFGASVLHYLLNTYRPNYSSRHAAANREQAKVASSYLRGFGQDEALSSVFDGKPGNNEATWRNNSNMRVVTGSVAGVSSQHPTAAFWDEIEFWKKEAIEQSWYVPESKNGYNKLWVAMSTRQRSFGCANWLSQNAEAKGVTIYKWTVFETMQRCRSCRAIDQHPHGNDTDRQSACNLWSDCLGLRGTKSTGWVPLEEVQALKRSLTPESWGVQGVCNRPSSSGLVLVNFEHSYKIEGGNYSHFVYQPNLPLYSAHDPAEGKKSCQYYIQIHDGCIYVFDEVIIDACPNTSTAKAAFYEHSKKMGYPDPQLIVVDPRRSDAIADWRQGTLTGEGIGRKYKAVASPMDEARGGVLIARTIEYLRKQIQDGDGVRRLYVNPKQCPGLVNAISEYHYPTDMQNIIQSDTPDKEYSDEIDPLRYFVQYYNFVMKFGEFSIRWIDA